MIRNLHRQLVALYRWLPEEVWKFDLLDAADYLREGMRVRGLEAQLQAAMLLSPLLPESARGQLAELLASFEPTQKPVTLAEEFGEAEAREIEAVQERARKWAEERMKR